MVTGKASRARAAVGDKPVLAYIIASSPQPQRGIAERVDALMGCDTARLAALREVGMSYYGVAMGGASVAASPNTSSSCS
jgi:hypothetical protein